ncbi:hypothetical protein ACHQM5_017514 [Ranunculus cassubicifolius]
MGYGGGGLARFKSAPASWFDSILEAEIPPPSSRYMTGLPPPSPSPSSSSNLSRNPAATVTVNNYSTTSSINSFARHNSSPPELLANLCSNLDSEDGLAASNYDIFSSILDIPATATTQMPRGDSDSTQTHLKRELSGDFPDMDMEKLFEDSVPCRVRAKRGCATHPRSIAERVRRTKISDRIRKLQELVPNMDKQTNTADMLEEAVEYVKFLQNQIQELNEHQKNCKCLGRE